MKIEYRFNKHGRAPHCFDVIDDTGDCVAIFRGLDKDAAKADARAFVAKRAEGAA